MAAYNCSTLRALPSLLFRFKELPDAMLLDGFQILDHTHPEMSSVSLIEMLKPFTRKIIAFVTILHLATQEKCASLLEKCALLVSWSTAGAIGHSYSLALYIMLVSKVPTAYCTVHPARGDQSFIHCFTLNIHNSRAIVTSSTRCLPCDRIAYCHICSFCDAATSLFLKRL